MSKYKCKCGYEQEFIDYAGDGLPFLPCTKCGGRMEKEIGGIMERSKKQPKLTVYDEADNVTDKVYESIEPQVKDGKVSVGSLPMSKNGFWDKPPNKRVCDGNCNKCLVVGRNLHRMAYKIFMEMCSKFGENEVYAIVQNNCANLTCCPICYIDDFCHIEGKDCGFKPSEECGIHEKVQRTN